MRIVEIPRYLDDKALDAVADAMGSWPPQERLLFDARATKWSSPYGFVSLLTAGQALAEIKAETPRLAVPDLDEVRSYWAKAGFFKHAAEFFDLVGKVPRRAADESSDVLVPVRPIRNMDDVHTLVEGLGERVSRMLTEELGIAPSATPRFGMALSEVCQNIVEHAGTGGWVAVQAHNWKKREGPRVVVCAVSDAGIGFRRSLESAEARKIGDLWGDSAAIEAALFRSVSRYRDPGRGQGLAMIKRYLLKWAGKLSVRSGTARLAFVPEWDDDLPAVDNLSFFPGSQIMIVVPAQV
jgi:anti-sigma regulatory factor (Ser/Thr protein kinase)